MTCKKLVIGILENGFNSKFIAFYYLILAIVKSVKRDIDNDRAFIEDPQVSSFFWFCGYFLEAREILSRVIKD